jgi:peptidoglycan/xylan/chitin deacetylase (PgdA/CDA1 family)
MHQAGITLGSHTRTHILLTNESPRRIKDELQGSRRDLENKLAVSIRHFAYPDGKFNKQSLRAVAAAGYRYAYTICRHRDPDSLSLTIPRKLLWEKSALNARGEFSPPVMSCLLNGVFDFRNTCGATHRSLVNEDHTTERANSGWAA